jgi:outer membrane protein X
MKKLLLFSAFIGFAFLAKAQSSMYKAFKVDVDLGYAVRSTGSQTGGAAVTVEPHYRLSDDFALGFRVEGAGFITTASSGQKEGDLILSYCATGDYYLQKTGFRPFIGAGAGVYHQLIVSGKSGNVIYTPGATDFGFFPRIGFETGHFRLSAAYDIAGSNSNYFAISIGFFLGGGQKTTAK